MWGHKDSICKAYSSTFSCGYLEISNGTSFDNTGYSASNYEFGFNSYAVRTYQIGDDVKYETGWVCMKNEGCNMTNPAYDVEAKTTCMPNWDYYSDDDQIVTFAGVFWLFFMFVFGPIIACVVITMCVRHCMGLPPCCCCGNRK